MTQELRAAIGAFRDDDGLRALILTGAGERAFCTGGDIGGGDPEHSRAVAAAPLGHGREMRDGMQAVVLSLSQLDKPSIAAIRGYAVAGGLAWRWRATSASQAPRPGSATPAARWACCPTRAAPGSSPAPWAWIAR
jgi:E-phenylitaconyl-CoA hydratase